MGSQTNSKALFDIRDFCLYQYTVCWGETKTQTGYWYILSMTSLHQLNLKTLQMIHDYQNYKVFITTTSENK